MGTREDGDFVIIRKLGHKRSGRFGVRYLVLMVQERGRCSENQ